MTGLVLLFWDSFSAVFKRQDGDVFNHKLQDEETQNYWLHFKFYYFKE